MLDTFRAFIAVNLDIAATRRVAGLQKTLRASSAIPTGQIAWVSAPNLHITLRHLGEIDAALAPALGDVLTAMMASTPPIRLQLGPLEAFPSREQARMVIVDLVDPVGTIQTLAQKIEQLAQSMGFVAEKRAFRPHLALGRMREPVNVQAWYESIQPAGLGEGNIADCALYKGEIKRGGAEYTALHRVAAATQPLRSQRPSRAPKPSQKPGRRSRAPVSEDGTFVEAIPGPPKLPDMMGLMSTAQPEAPRAEVDSKAEEQPVEHDGMKPQ